MKDNGIIRFSSTAIVLLWLAVFAATATAQDNSYRLPYKNTYVKEPLVTDNAFRGAKAEKIPIPDFEAAKRLLPHPVWDGHAQEIDMYWRAWEIAFRNLCHPREDSGFVSTYIDTAYNGNIFMWDSAFITMFARYGFRAFPFQRTLDNFYSHQHPDGFICREIMSDGWDCFQRHDPVSTGPNLLPWSEMIYFRHTGDVERLHKIFPALCAYNKWLRLNRTWRNGTYWSSGWGTGMDNIPRIPQGYNQNFSNAHMVWLDTNLQQIFIDNLLLEMGFYIERWQEIEDFEDEAKMLCEYVRANMWDDRTGFLYDLYRDDILCPTMSVSAFWALHTDVLNKLQIDRLVSHLRDTATFARPYPVPSISADNPKYNERGRYWQGGVWAPTNYMIIDGLRKNGYEDLACEIADKYYRQVFDVFGDKGTFYEYYSPEHCEEGFLARDEFVGWTGLVPISLLMEYQIGISSDYVSGSIVWNIRRTERHGIENYAFGPEATVSLIADGRRSASAEAVVTVRSDTEFDITLKCSGKEKKFKVAQGENRFTI